MFGGAGAVVVIQFVFITLNHIYEVSDGLLLVDRHRFEVSLKCLPIEKQSINYWYNKSASNVCVIIIGVQFASNISTVTKLPRSFQ